MDQPELLSGIVIRVKNILTPAEVAALQAWAVDAAVYLVPDTSFGYGYGCARLEDIPVTVPELALVEARVREFIGAKADGWVEEPYHKFHIAQWNIGGRTNKGTYDADWPPEAVAKMQHLRVNVLISQPTSGGAMTVNGVPVDLNEGDAWSLTAGKYPVIVTPVGENKPRIMLSYGFEQTKDEFDAIVAEKSASLQIK